MPLSTRTQMKEQDFGSESNGLTLDCVKLEMFVSINMEFSVNIVV